MKYKEIKINNLIVSDKYTIYDYEENEKEIYLYVKSKNRMGKCPDCMQFADRFHLFENIIEYLKDIFYSEMQDKIFIQNDKILE